MTTLVAGHSAEMYIVKTLGIDGVVYNWQCIVCLAEGEEDKDHHTVWIRARAHNREARDAD